MKCTQWTAVLRRVSLTSVLALVVMASAACSSSSFSNGNTGAQPGTDASASGGAGANGGGARNAGGTTHAGGVTSGVGGNSAGGVTSGVGGSNAGGVTSTAGAAGVSGVTGAGGSGIGGSLSDAGIHGACGALLPPEPKPLPEPLIPNPDPNATLKEIYVSGPASTYAIGSNNGTTSMFLRDQGVYSDGTVRNIDNIFADIDYHTKVTWTSSDPTIAAVSSGDTRTAGGVQGFREGTVTITVSVNSVSMSVCFVVTPPVVAGLTITAPSSLPSNPNAPVVAKPGDAIPLTCTETMSDGTKTDVTSSVTWASSVTTVATVSPAGATDALSGGTTEITASLPAWVQAINQTASTGTATVDVIGSTGLQSGDPCGGAAQNCAAGLSCCVTGRGTPSYCIPTMSPSAPCPPPPPATP